MAERIKLTDNKTYTPAPGDIWIKDEDGDTLIHAFRDGAWEFSERITDPIKAGDYLIGWKLIGSDEHDCSFWRKE